MIVAQASDIHAAPDNDNLTRFDRALSWLTALELDALVLSGDLIDDGWVQGYEEIAVRLRGLRCPVLLLPGNSDDRNAMWEAFPERVGAVADHAAMHFVAQIGDLRLIGIDTCLSDTSAGNVGEHVSWLEAALMQAGTDASLVFAHHHLVGSGIEPMDASMALGVPLLRDMLRRCARRPLAFSTGHVHRAMTGMLAGVPVHVCGSICPANPLWFGGPVVPGAHEGPMVMIHRLADGGLVSSHVAV